jgi:hypothetical protein
MKTKEQEIALLGLKEVNESEKTEITGGVASSWKDSVIVCCIDIPPMIKPEGYDRILF